MKTRTTRIAALGISGLLAFGLTACEVEDDDPDTAIIEDDDPAVVEDDPDTTIEEGDDTTIEEGDETTIEEGDETTDDTSTDDDS